MTKAKTQPNHNPERLLARNLTSPVSETPEPTAAQPRPKTAHHSRQAYPEPRTGGRAVIYLRVSDPKQVQKDYDPEGIESPRRVRRLDLLERGGWSHVEHVEEVSA
jgi:hypothetical protein